MKKMFKSTVSILLIMTMIVSLFTIVPITVSAASGVSYIERSWNGSRVVSTTKTCTEYSSPADWTGWDVWSGWYVVDRDITIEHRFHCNSNVNIILCDGCTLTLKGGLTVPDWGSLNIYGQTKDTGKIYSHPKEGEEAVKDAAVIGGLKNDNAGNIIIHGGTLDLDSPFNDAFGFDSRAACLGGGYKGTVKSVKIYGGDIKCDSSCTGGGAAIGGGKYGAPSNGEGLLIYGGKINAKAQINGGDGAAAIGSGYDAPHAAGTIRIYGGEITARASSGAAIGSGEKTDSNNIVITGGFIAATATTASGYSGAAIGSGMNGRAHGITISDAAIIAVSGSGAGIGSGEKGPANGVTVSKSIVLTASTHGGAGIGSGYKGDCGDINISDSIAFGYSKEFKSTDELVAALQKMGSAKVPALDKSMETFKSYAQNALSLLGGLIYFLTPDHSGAAIGGGVDGNVDTISITRSNVVAVSENYSAGIGSGEDGDFGTITIKDSEIHATSGDYGAAIGSGDEAKKCGTITISGSDVEASAGTDAAAIGTGNECDSACDAINITNSTVTANGGRYAAGIGGGDAVGGGTINITNSTIKEAKSGTDGAGIGGGESGNGGNITIKYSTVTAHGGGYAAGIGGGDAGDGGNITIDNSTVSAYGGTDAAGIGGGEDGDGGYITIKNKSDVYADGNSYGAGIGGGEDAGVHEVSIDSSSKVKAYAGGDGNGVAIGHGDYNKFAAAFTGNYPSNGTLALSTKSMVEAGSNPSNTSTYTNDDIWNACRKNKYAYVHPCEHKTTYYQVANELYHYKCCSICGEKISEYERHTFGSDNKCTVCGSTTDIIQCTFIEQNNDGEVTRTNALQNYTDWTIPYAENAPDGMVFRYWQTEENGKTVIYRPGRDTILYGNLTLKAVYVPGIKTTYIDENYEQENVTALRITKSNLSLDYSGWYIIDSESDLSSSDEIILSQDVNIIIADDADVTIKQICYNFSGGYKASVSIFGQAKQTGKLTATSSYFSVGNYKQYGGNVHVYMLRAENDFIFACGTFESDVSAFGQNTMQFSWYRYNQDSIKIDSFSGAGTVKIADGKAFQDESEHIIKGTLTSSEVHDYMEGYTITPAAIHRYGQPTWVWSKDYSVALAIFECTDDGVDETFAVQGDITVDDNGFLRSYKATCTFNGKKYLSNTIRIEYAYRVTSEYNSGGYLLFSGDTIADGKFSSVDVEPGNKVIIYPIAESGSMLKSLTAVRRDDGRKIKISDDNTFIMPECDVIVKAEFVSSIPQTEPYIDEDGAYILGTVEHFEIDGKNYAVNEDGTVGDELESIELSYFDFALLEDNTYQINYYTGPTENLTALVIPKTFNGKPITVLGNDQYEGIFKEKVSLPEVVLNENIVTITDAAFNKNNVEKVSGDTSNLRVIGEFAFGKAEDGTAAIDVTLDYHDSDIELGGSSFNDRDVIFRIKHLTTFSGWNPMAESITFVFTDDHTYGEPEWTWADDYSSASATFICTDPRCEHEETVKASVSKSEETSKTFYTATVEFEGEPYTNVKTVDKVHSAVTIADTTNGMVTADKSEAYVGEEVTLTITPDAGYKLNTLIVKDANNHEVSLSGNKFTMPDCDVTVTATFAANDYTITYNIGENGSVSGVHSANIGNEIELTITPNGGYELDTLSVRDSNNSEIDVTGNKFIMPADNVIVEAAFKKTDYTITYVESEHGSVLGNTTAQFNDEVTLTVTPDDGYAIMWVSAVDERGEEYNVEIIDNILYMPDANVMISAEFIKTTPAKEPYIDSDGAYHLGNIEYVTIDGNNHEVKDDRYVGGQLESVDVSYFDFKMINSNSEYRINYYTGPTEDLSELVIPKTFNGKPVTVLGNDINYADNSKCRLVPQGTPSFTLVLNENITEIKPYSFYAVQVTNITGNTSSLSRIGEYAFSWANSRNGYVLDIQLDYPGRITTGAGIFNHMNVTARIKHATTFSRSSFGQHLIAYVFTDAHTYGAPAWSWSENNTSATATFTCTDSRCKHEETVNATLTKESRGGDALVTATAEFEGETYTDQKEVQIFARHSLSLDGSIGVNFYLNLTEEEAQSATINFNWFNKELNDAQITLDPNGSGYYKVTCPVAVAEMTYDITATLTVGDQTYTDTYSAITYADVILTDENFKTTYIEQKGEEKYTQLVTLIKAMLDYGAKAQTRFVRDTENLANQNLVDDDADSPYYYVPAEVTADMIDTGSSGTTADLSAYGLEYTGTSIVYLSETSIRHYFKIVDETAFVAVSDNITFNGNKVGYTVKGDEIYFELKNVAAADLDTLYTLKIGDIEYQYAVLDYVKACLSTDRATADTKALAAATYRYNQAANAYFGG